MSKRDLPHATVPARPGVRADIAKKVLDRWNPDVKAADDSAAAATISVLDVIGQDFYGEGVTSKRIAGALRQIGDRDVIVSINSPGGDYFEGLAIYNLLVDHPGHVTVKILGLAASAASIIAMAGDEILIGRAAFLMIHNTWVLAAGDRHAFRDVADWLEPFDAAAVSVYCARCGEDEAAMAAMLDKETWIGGQKAIDMGLADAFLGEDETMSMPTNQARQSPSAAQKKMKIALSKAGLSRKEARQLSADLKGGTPRAAQDDKLRAAVAQTAQNALEKLNTI